VCLLISAANPTFELRKTATAQIAGIFGRNGTATRWSMYLGENTAESGSNVGSDFQLNSHNDAGSVLATPLKFTRSTGLGTVAGDPTQNLGIATKQYVDSKVPTGGAFGTVNVQKFTASGTYTPTSGMKFCTIEVLGGGGGGGGVGDTTGSCVGAAGGGAGGYSRLTASAATIGASQTVTIGNAGSAAGNGGNGGAGGQSSVGTLCVANGGAGGIGQTTGTYFGGLGGALAGAVGDITATGAPGGNGSAGTVLNNAGVGGSNVFGGGGRAGAGASGSAAGGAASNYGSGGGGAWGTATTTQRGGGAGSAGFVIITEYI